MDYFGIKPAEAYQPALGMINAITHVQKAISNNVANINTPGYQAQHPDFVSLIAPSDNPFETKLSVSMGASMLPQVLQHPSGKPDLQTELMMAQDNLLKFNVISTNLQKVFTRLKEAGNVGR
jgi:flagellar basal-body rod protein FlgB